MPANIFAVFVIRGERDALLDETLSRELGSINYYDATLNFISLSSRRDDKSRPLITTLFVTAYLLL